MLSETHSRLWHYTTPQGLFGILESGRLWATHFKTLNGPTEFLAFLPVLEDSFAKATLKLWREGLVEFPNSTDPDLIGLLIRTMAREVVSTLHKSTFGPRSFGQPFITSFCTSGTPYIQKNGLLSQKWRGYGHDGGYAIEFDTKALERLLAAFAQQFEIFGVFADVIYDEHSPSYSEWLDLVSQFVSLVGPVTRYLDWLRLAPPKDGARSLQLLFQVAARLKHVAFSEEQEVRIALMRIEQGAERPLAPLKFDAPVTTPRIELFEPASVHGAIRKIIVGPHPMADGRAQTLRLFLATRGIEADVAISEIPYRARKN